MTWVGEGKLRSTEFSLLNGPLNVVQSLLLAQMRSAGRVGKCLLLGADRM
jgi:hypothetical protein